MNFSNLLRFLPRSLRLVLVHVGIFTRDQIRYTKFALTAFVVFQIVLVTIGCVVANKFSESIGSTIVGLSALMVLFVLLFVFIQFSVLVKAIDPLQNVGISLLRTGNILVPGEPIDPQQIVDSVQGDKALRALLSAAAVTLYVDVFTLVFRAWFYPKALLIMVLAGVAVSFAAVSWGGVRVWLPRIQRSVFWLSGVVIVGAALIMINPGGIGAILSSYTSGQDQERIIQMSAQDQDALDLIRLKELLKEQNQLISIHGRNPDQEQRLTDVQDEIQEIRTRHARYVLAGGEPASLSQAGIWLRQNQQVVVGVVLLIALLIFLSKWKGGKSEPSSTSGSVSIRTMVIIVAVLVGLWWFSPLIIGTAKEISDAYPLRGGPKMQEPDGRRAPANLNGGDWEKVVDLALDPKVESQDTKFVAEPGDELYIMAKGTVKCDPRWKQAVSLDGTTISETGLTFVCPEALMGQLLVMTPGEAQPVGTRRQIKVQKGGPISVGINDLVGWFGDNTESGTRVVILRKKRDGPKVSARATTTSESSNRWLALFILYRNITFYDIIFL